jgi:hypothetical protein
MSEPITDPIVGEGLDEMPEFHRHRTSKWEAVWYGIEAKRNGKPHMPILFENNVQAMRFQVWAKNRHKQNGYDIKRNGDTVYITKLPRVARVGRVG